MRFLSRKDLRDERGIPYSRQHLDRLVKAKKFPAPVKPGGRTGPNAWIDSEIDDWQRQRIDERDAKNNQQVS